MEIFQNMGKGITKWKKTLYFDCGLFMTIIGFYYIVGRTILKVIHTKAEKANTNHRNAYRKIEIHDKKLLE